ncbi:hypothetical protein PAEPH01_1870 [Pancytospora epiphaga]|nr:hypothetical protein PAEPH01_1870 [Pancytospora epiphaga]
MKRNIFTKEKQTSFENISEIKSYRESWSNYANKNKINRIVSKQNLIPGNEVCKMNRTSLYKYFSPCETVIYTPPVEHDIIKQHSSKITCLHFMKRYDFLISASLDGKVILSKNEPLRMFIGHSQGVSGVGLSFDEMELLTASHDGWVKKWDVESGRCTQRWNLKMDIMTCSVNDYGVFVGGKDGETGLVDTRSSTTVYTRKENTRGVITTCISETTVGLVRKNGSIEFRDLSSGALLKELRGSYKGMINSYMRHTYIARTSYGIYKLANGEIKEENMFNSKIGCIGRIPEDSDVLYSTMDSEVLHLNRKDKIKILSNQVTQLCASGREKRKIGIGYLDGNIEIIGPSSDRSNY